MLVPKRSIKILDFDIENRPLSYWIPDRPTAEITAIASCWTHDIGSMQVHLLGLDDPTHMLLSFITRYNEADMVTGHYIRKHDLPIINGALMEFNLPILLPKLTCDTKLDMKKKSDIPATQEFLLEMLNVLDEDGNRLQKLHMSQSDWREGNRLTLEGLRKTKARAADDVYDHMRLRLKMQELGLLRSPKMWFA